MVQAQPVHYVQYTEQIQQMPVQLYPMQTMSLPQYAPVEYESFEPPPVEVREREEEPPALARERRAVQRSAPPPPPEEEPEEMPVLKRDKKKAQRAARAAAPPVLPAAPPPPPEQKLEIRKVEVEVDKVRNSCAQAIMRVNVLLCVCVFCIDSLS